MGETVFVTGATGRIGAPLARALLARGDRVVALVRDPASAAELESAGARLIKGTLADHAALAEGMSGASAVYHLAGGVRGPGAETADRLNREGTLAVVEAAKTRTLRAFLLASTGAIYGDRSGLWVAEDYAPNPNTAYGLSKVAAEEAVVAAGLPVRIARIAAVYGPGTPFLQVERMRAGRAWLPGEGRNIVPTVHIDDAVGALIAMGDADTSGVYNVAGRTTPSLGELFKGVHALAGGEPVKFWSTWIPSVFQLAAADLNERVCTRIGRRPRLTEDTLRLWTASVRLRTERLEKELGYTWRWPDHAEGLRDVIARWPA